MNNGSIGLSLALIAIGAVLTWAVDATVSGLDIKAVGAIVMVVGLVGLAFTLLFWSSFAPFGQGVSRRRPHAIAVRDDFDRQNPVVRQSDLDRQNPVVRQSDLDRQNPVVRQSDLDRQNPVLRQDDLDRQNPVVRQDDLDRQNPVVRRDDPARRP